MSIVRMSNSVDNFTQILGFLVSIVRMPNSIGNFTEILEKVKADNEIHE